jgi:type IV pilus assembly protein PilY1
MRPTTATASPSAPALCLPLVLLAAALCAPLTGAAAVADLSNVPSASASPSSVKPNIMFILDDSGSMSWTYMPDAAGDFRGAYGYASSHC